MSITLKQAVDAGYTVVLMGENRVHCIGDIAYRFTKPGGTLSRFAKGYPVMWVDGEWRTTQLGCPVIREWGAKVTPIGRS